MSWTTISGVSDEQVASVATGSNVQVTISGACDPDNGEYVDDIVGRTSRSSPC
jgi:hypothetical protein